MTNYRRAFVANSLIFITANTFNRIPLLITNIDLFKESILQSQKCFEYDIIGFVVLPDHFHMLLRPKTISEYPKIISALKSYFSKNITGQKLEQVRLPLSKSQLEKREKGVWQRRYWEHTIRDRTDLQRHLDYIHYNPVKHHHVKQVKDWNYSSFLEFVRLGYYENDWGGVRDVKNIIDLDFD